MVHKMDETRALMRGRLSCASTSYYRHKEIKIIQEINEYLGQDWIADCNLPSSSWIRFPIFQGGYWSDGL